MSIIMHYNFYVDYNEFEISTALDTTFLYHGPQPSGTSNIDSTISHNLLGNYATARNLMRARRAI